LAHSSRGWTGARTPSAIKRVRQATRRRAINQPRRTAAKTLVNKAVLEAGNGNPEEAQQALARAISALDRAAKAGAIHRNAADRRKSRLMLKVNAALGGEHVVSAGKTARTTGKAAAAKQAKARIAASKATKAKQAQTSVGRAREALARTTRAGSAEPEQPTATEAAAPSKPSARSTKASTAKSTTKASTKATTKASAKASAKPAASKGSARGSANKT
jgi:small subunit ribosomal protein S20